MAETYSFAQWGSTSEEILKSQFPLHAACRDGDVERLSLLLVEAQHGIYEEDSFYGWTPAHWAAYFGKLGCLMQMLEKGLHPDCSTIHLTQAPSHLASFAGNSHCLKWLIHCGSKIDRQLGCLRKLLTLNHHRPGVNSNLRTSRFHQTPAHLSAFGGHSIALMWLLEAEADLDSQDYLGETPIHKAARTQSMECISLLISHGARLYIKNNNGDTPADVARLCGHEQCGQYLEECAQRQATEAKGVYQEQAGTTKPSPYDVTAMAPADGSMLNGHTASLQNGISEAMDIEEPESGHGALANQGGAHMQNGTSNGAMGEEELATWAGELNGHHVNGNTNGENLFHKGSDTVHSDVLLDVGVSSNVVPVAGRKRSREESVQLDYKRRRKSGDTWEDHDGTTLSTHPPSTPKPAPAEPANEDHRQYCTGYDYNGIPQFADEGVNPIFQAQSLEQEVHPSHKCTSFRGHLI